MTKGDGRIKPAPAATIATILRFLWASVPWGWATIVWLAIFTL